MNMFAAIVSETFILQKGCHSSKEQNCVGLVGRVVSSMPKIHEINYRPYKNDIILYCDGVSFFNHIISIMISPIVGPIPGTHKLKTLSRSVYGILIL